MTKSVFEVGMQKTGVEAQVWHITVSPVIGEAADQKTTFTNIHEAFTAIFAALNSGRFVHIDGTLTPLPALPYHVIAALPPDAKVA